MRQTFALLTLLLTGCASTGDDPFCIMYDERGRPVGWAFNPSQAQSNRAARNPDVWAVFPRKENPLKPPAGSSGTVGKSEGGR